MKIIILATLAFIVFAGCNKINTKNCCAGGNVASVDSSFIAMPDIFTPNGDGINDILFVQNRNLSGLKLTISKGSKIIFETTGTTSGWDGTYKSKMSKEMDYSYVVEAFTLSGKSLSLSGDICLIRDNCSKTPIVNCCFASQFSGSAFDKNIPSGESIKVCN